MNNQYRLSCICQYLNHPEPVFEPPTEEEEEEEKGLLVEKNDKRAYNGPFADLEEENFYRMIPNLEELIPSLYAKKNKKIRMIHKKPFPPKSSRSSLIAKISATDKSIDFPPFFYIF